MFTDSMIHVNQNRAAIISEFTTRGTNYGNTLQAYALQRHLREHMGISAVSLERAMRGQITVRRTPQGFVRFAGQKFMELTKRGKNEPSSIVDPARLAAFHEFQDKNMKYEVVRDFSSLPTLASDAFIVGSDVVWGQVKGLFDRSKYLDFNMPAQVKKIAYAASFGADWIPEENRPYLKSRLSSFDAISVREGSSVSLLNAIGVKGAVHVLDPTMLLSCEEWREVEAEPKALEAMEGPFVFAYLLGTDVAQRGVVSQWCEGRGLRLVTIPCASGEKSDGDNTFGNLQVNDCSPGGWLWLIDHSQVVFTDSFHGVALSTKLGTPFVAFERGHFDNRVGDFLRTTCQEKARIGIDMLEGPFEPWCAGEETVLALAAALERSTGFLRETLYA
ncbi:MAG: polysaccharide pyruvyl transferase family protein [Coriobacteriia bacterium]